METTETIKSPNNQQTLQYFKELLLEKRREAKEQEGKIEDNISNLSEADDADQSSITHHMGDSSSDTEEKQMNYQFLERTRKYIKQINDALQRIEDGIYGICKATGKPISKGRLKSVPLTRYSIEAKEQGIDNE